MDPEDLPALEQNVEYDGGDDDTSYAGSGTYEVLWEREATISPDFKPIASAEDGGLVKFFGRVNLGAGFGDFGDIGDYVSLDEDVISGGPGTPPVMTLNISVPDAANGEVQIQVIYYETSGFEYIQGGDKCFDDPDNTSGFLTADDDDGEAIARAAVQAACTSDETGATDTRNDAGEIVSDNASFVLNAESDEDAGGDGKDIGDLKQLALVETGRFTGVFQGYLRLTDADGDGGDSWGLPKISAEYKHADESADQINPTVAVIGVGDGPVTINYKDTSGTNRTYEVQIDIEPPTIQIDSPAHNGRSDDEKPSFIGSVNDSDSGLAADSFQLDVDNRDDREIPLTILEVPSGVWGTKDGDDIENGQVRRRLDYRVPDDGSSQYGVIAVTADGDIYRTESSASPKEHKSLEADDFADGSPDGEFNGELEIDFDEFPPVSEDADFEFNNAIDFQAVVRDLAGNVGFSDSDATKPRFIDALGEEKQTRSRQRSKYSQRSRCVLAARGSHRRCRPIHPDGSVRDWFLRDGRRRQLGQRSIRRNGRV